MTDAELDRDLESVSTDVATSLKLGYDLLNTLIVPMDGQEQWDRVRAELIAVGVIMGFAARTLRMAAALSKVEVMKTVQVAIVHTPAQPTSVR